jgi:ribosome-binding factor A
MVLFSQQLFIYRGHAATTVEDAFCHLSRINMLRAFKVIALPDEHSSPTMFRCCEDRLLPIVSIFKIPCNADQMNGSEISVVFSHTGIYSWIGKNATKELRAWTAKCIQDARDTISLNSGVFSIPLMSYEQGGAPQEFWKLLQISSEPAEIPTQSSRLNDPLLMHLNEPTAPLDLSSTTSNRIKIAVVGGGATGVFCARQMLAPLYKQYLNITVTLFEKSDSIGGMARKSGNYEAGCPFFTARSAEFKEFTRRSFESGYVQPLEMNTGIGENLGSSFRTFRFAAPSYESAEDQEYIYKNSPNAAFYNPKSPVPFFYPDAYLPSADCFSRIRTDSEPRTQGQKPSPKPIVNQPEFLFHEAHSLSQSMSAGNLWTGRLWRGHPSMTGWFASLLTDPRITIKLGTEITSIERLQKRGGGCKVYGFAKDEKVESFIGDFDYIAICTEFSSSIKLTKSISRMMHLALGHAYQNDLDPSDACNSYHQELVVEFNPPLATTLDMLWVESSNTPERQKIGLAFALKDASRQRLFTTGVDRMRGHNDRVVSMAKGYSHSTPQSHPVGGGHSSVAESELLRDVWVLYSERGWNCLGQIGYHFLENLDKFKSTLQRSVLDQKQASKRCLFFVKQCEVQISRWQMLIQGNEVKTHEYKLEVQHEYDAYDMKLETLLQMKETTSILKNGLCQQLEQTVLDLDGAETTKQHFELSLPTMEQDVINIDIELLSLVNDLQLSQDSAARCRLDLLAQEDKISASTQHFDRDAIIDSVIESQYLASCDPDASFHTVSSHQSIDWDQNPTVVSLARLDSDVSLEQDLSFRNEEIADDDVDYLMHKSAKEARAKLEENHLRREKERKMQEELSRLLILSQSAEQIVQVQTSKISALRTALASSVSKIDVTKKELQSMNIYLENMRMRHEDIVKRLDKANTRFEFLCADEVALRVEMMQHKQRCNSRVLIFQSESEVLTKNLVEAQKKHDLWILRRDRATNSLALVQDYVTKTCDAAVVFENELKVHSAGIIKHLCKDAIRVCEQSIFANLRDCHGDTIVHYVGQQYVGLNSAELRKSKTKLLRYLSNYGAEALLTEKVQEVMPTSAVAEPEFVQSLWENFLDLKSKYADFVLSNLIADQDDIEEGADDDVEESHGSFIQASGNKIQIDSKSDDFSPFSLLRLAAKLCKTCCLDRKKVVMEMLASDFKQMFAVINKYFHEYVSIIPTEEDAYDDEEVCDTTVDAEDEESDEVEESENEETDDDVGSCSDHDGSSTARFFRESDDDSDFLDELSVDRQRRHLRSKLTRGNSASIEQIFSQTSRAEYKEVTSKHQSAASLCFDGSSLFDFHTKVCVCGNWLIESSIEGAFLSGSGGAHRLMQSIEDDPVMLARLGEDALANQLYSDDIDLRSQMQMNSQKQITLRRMAQRSNFRPQQSLRNNFINWRRVVLKGRLLFDLLKRIKYRFFNSCVIRAFSIWAEATEEQWAFQFSATLQWTRTLKSRAFVHWRVVLEKCPEGVHVKTWSRLFGPQSEEDEDPVLEELPKLHSVVHDSAESENGIVPKVAVPLHTDLSNLHDWCQCPLPPFSWTSADEQCLKLPDISGSTDADLAKLAKEFLKNKPTKQSEYIFRLGWLLYWYRDNNEFAPKSLATKMSLWEEKYLGLSPHVSGQVRPKCFRSPHHVAILTVIRYYIFIRCAQCFRCAGGCRGGKIM